MNLDSAAVPRWCQPSSSYFWLEKAPYSPGDILTSEIHFPSGFSGRKIQGLPTREVHTCNHTGLNSTILRLVHVNDKKFSGWVGQNMRTPSPGRHETVRPLHIHCTTLVRIWRKLSLLKKKNCITEPYSPPPAKYTISSFHLQAKIVKYTQGWIGIEKRPGKNTLDRPPPSLLKNKTEICPLKHILARI